ncbi:PucR family transcriptional regulator [Natronincola ferrireducens]|uniref:PucR C-terminal helix-turn-helix domain-containing protein n=1 Tax=Natronincola ferrireducens TaxID=393762 RepID=A0A1G9FTD5_9FIRM|nr:PucR family transcriptional regulator [Natronincola ferrireducens]SDK91671.1 PucR C-terminal helix-turn-helix domain-containing protein [Natronincola ferrireducens]
MPVKVRNVLDLDIFQEVNIIAGEQGLNKEIHRVSFVDCPISSDVIDKGIMRKGDFYLSSLFAAKDSIDSMLQLINILSQSKSSGICIINEYIDSVPEEVINLANKNSLPIFLADKNISYADIIKSIMELIVKSKEDTINEMKIKSILKLDQDEKILQAAYDLNNNFMENIIAFYLIAENDNGNFNYICENINSRDPWLALKYDNGILVILSSHQSNDMKNLKNFFQSLVETTCKDYTLGISNEYGELKDLKKAVLEAIFSCDFSNILGKKTVEYNELGVYSLLMSIKHKIELKEFYNKTILPLKQYDGKYKMDLFHTAIHFIDNDGDYKKTANSLFQHENTIRYRITRMKQILHMEDKNIEFYMQLSIGVKIHKLINYFEKTL